jgi:glycerol transport system ATP-binding protein
MAEITLQSISHSYHGKGRGRSPDTASYALHKVDLCWRDGGAYALLGPSGCGKTTLLGIISGLIQPTSGRVLYDGKDVTSLPSRDRNIAQVFQFPVVYDTMTVRQNLAFPLRNRGLAESDIDRRVDRIAEILDLTATLQQRATGLTADQKQILALGRGLVREDVAAILFDEPLTVIDPHRKWLLRRKLKEIHKQFHHTLIYVTHDQTEALTFADEVVVMNAGAVLQRGSPEDLFRRPAHTYVGYFIGSPGMNVMPCQLERQGSGVRARIAEATVALPTGLGEAALECGNSDFELGIRPEHIAILEGDNVEDGMAMTVLAMEDHGRFRIVAGRISDHVIKLRIADDMMDPDSRSHHPPDLSIGMVVRIRFKPEDICLYHNSRIVTAEERETANVRAGVEST